MTSYLILPTEQEALDRSHTGHVTDTVIKEVGIDNTVLSKDKAAAVVQKRPAVATKIATQYVTQYRWARDVGKDGQTALVIDGDEQLLTAAEQAALVPKLDDGPGGNWEKPLPPVLSGPVDVVVP